MANRQSVGRKPNPKSLENLTGGSRKGRPNRTGVLAKEAIAQAFDDLGGAAGLLEWAAKNEKNQTVFYTVLLPKLIPVQTEISGKDGEDIRVRQVNDDADAVTRRLTAGLAAAGIASAASGTVQ